MTGDWTKMCHELARDPDVIQIAPLTLLDEFGVAGRRHTVWSGLDHHSDDGTTFRIVSAFLDRLAACPGFADALRAVGWLDRCDQAFDCPGYTARKGRATQARAPAQRRVERHRYKRNAATVTDVTLAPLPEKSREEFCTHSRARSERGAVGISPSSHPRHRVLRGKAKKCAALWFTFQLIEFLSATVPPTIHFHANPMLLGLRNGGGPWAWLIRRLSGFVLTGLLITGVARAVETPEFEQTVKPFLTEHCTKCHGEKKQKGDLRIDTLSLNFSSPAAAMHWTDIMDRMNAAEMPPEDEEQPKAGEVAKIAEWINAQLTEADAAQKSGLEEKVAFRRLTREEYRNTIRDLLGVNYDASDPAGLPEDPDWQGFQRIGSVLTVSPAHIEKYLAAAETVLNEAIATGPAPAREVIHWDPFLLRAGFAWGNPRKELTARGLAGKVRVDITPNNNAYGLAGGNELLTIKTTGEYLVRLKLSALRPPGGPAPRVSVYAADLGRTLFESDVEAPEDQPITVEFRTHLPAGAHPIRIFNAVHGPAATDHANQPGFSHCYIDLHHRQPWQIKLTDDDYRPRVPFILLDSVEWDGPIIEAWPPAAHQDIFFAGEKAVKDAAYAREILTRFASRAYRRPATPDEVQRLLKIFDESQSLGDNFETSVRTAMLGVLCSKDFVYLIEGDIDQPAAKLTDWELASRLSYFLWSTTPDARLLDLARQGKLHEPATLRAEVERMLHDERIGAFADSFPRQWLQLRRVGMFPPDPKLYPDYDDYLEKSMVGETTCFFREVLTQNLPLRDFLDSDWTMLNHRLAEHYGIAGVEGEQFQRVALKPDDHRGGLLTQASILGLTSDGTRHRPVHRGKWILESIIGRPPPPPPPNVPAIKSNAPSEPKMSLRAKLEAHRTDANCAGCHRKIDPLGLAFENYDAIGHWRTVETVRDGSGVNPPVDASGELADGRKFADPAGLKKLLLADEDKFAAAFTEKLATYALRRGMTFGDRAQLKHIAEEAKGNDYPLTSLVEDLATSDLFQKR